MSWPAGTETRTYWKAGDGNPFSGGCIGYDSVWRNSDGVVIASSGGRPPGAVTIPEAEYDTLLAQCIADGNQTVIDGDAWLAGMDAEREALQIAARGKLVSGDPLTAEEAAIITGGL
ncbi:MAG TPA: hypothetical protein VMW08_01070 [Acidimicrobiales bacterium]|nr:hypothetical protein [Acidimicrobiales bacterium]